MDKQYQVLARKYRPKNFSELLGQTHVSQALANAIDTGRLHHAYLFTGTRGVGKTTIARILAKCLNCETGITSTPCGVCDTCQSIDAGRFLDLIEIDAASRTKVEDTRELLENVPYAPVQGRYKVYLIDEVHMLSTHSFNALLKTLEEPPEHVKFIFATTDPQKLPITIISRCLQFVLRPMPQALLAEHLAKVLQLENIQYSESALWQLSSAAKGSVRDALSLTDQAIAFGGGAIQADTVNEMLGLVNSTDVLALIDAIYRDDKMAVSAQISLMREKMVDATAVFDELIDRIHQMALLQVLPQSPLDMSEEEQAILTTLSQQISADVLQLYYEILIKSRDGIRLASTPMQALEMGILRLLAFRPLAVGEMSIHDKMNDNINNDINHQIHPSASDTVVKLSSDHEAEQANQTEYVTASSSGHENFDSLADASVMDDLDGTDSSLDADMHIEMADVAADSADGVAGESTGRSSTDIVSASSVHGDDANLDMMDANHSAAVDALGELGGSADDPNTHEKLEHIQAEPSLAVMATEHLDEAKDLAEADFTEAIEDDSTIDAADVALDDVDGTSKAVSNDQPVKTDHRADAALTTHEQLLERLKPTAVELTGTWDAQKWDYWLHLARIDGHFSADELALMAGSMMTGEIDGKSHLHVAEQNSQVQSSFNSLLKKISDHYPSLKLSPEPIINDQLELVPRQLFQERQHALRIDAQNQLINSPVFQKLWQEGYIINDGSPVLTNTKLSID